MAMYDRQHRSKPKGELYAFLVWVDDGQTVEAVKRSAASYRRRGFTTTILRRAVKADTAEQELVCLVVRQKLSQKGAQ